MREFSSTVVTMKPVVFSFLFLFMLLGVGAAGQKKPAPRFRVGVDTVAVRVAVSESFSVGDDVSRPFRDAAKPRVAILREQGVNSQYEMAAAFMRAGFSAVDVHMSDLLGGDDDLGEYQGIVACGGFSFGDVLGAGGGWFDRPAPWNRRLAVHEAQQPLAALTQRTNVEQER